MVVGVREEAKLWLVAKWRRGRVLRVMLRGHILRPLLITRLVLPLSTPARDHPSRAQSDDGDQVPGHPSTREGLPPWNNNGASKGEGMALVPVALLKHQWPLSQYHMPQQHEAVYGIPTQALSS